MIRARKTYVVKCLKKKYLVLQKLRNFSRLNLNLNLSTFSKKSCGLKFTEQKVILIRK